MTAAVPSGVWRHWKQHDYLVLGLGHDANAAGRDVVVYVPLYPGQGPRLAVRTVADFTAWLDPATGGPAREGDPGAVRRFTYVGSD